MKLVKPYLKILCMISITILFAGCLGNDDDDVHDPDPVVEIPNFLPVEVLATNQIEINNSTGDFQDFIEIEKSSLLTINASGDIQGGSNAVKLTIVIKLDDKIISSDSNTTTITCCLRASPSTTVFLEPGNYNIEVDRSISGNHGSASLLVNYFAIAAERVN